MMKTKQEFFEWVGITPGPWYKDHSEENGWPVVEDGYDFSVAMMSIYQLNSAEHNSDLIKESPELLWASVEKIYFDEINEKQTLWGFHTVKHIESATGKTWSEIIEFLES